MLGRLCVLVFCLIAAVQGASAQQPRSTVRMVTQNLPNSLGLPFSANGSPSSFYWHALFDTLTEWSVDDQMQGALAETWMRRDPQTWVFTLRPGVVFSNGDPMDAEAVTATINWLVQSTPGKATLWGGQLTTIIAAEAENPSTVVIRTNRPDPLIPNRLTAIFILPPFAFTGADTDAFAQSPIGTGPFALETWRDRRGHTVMTTSARAWRKAPFDRFVLVPAPNAMSRVQALVTGAVDLMFTVPPELLPDIEAAGLQVIHVPMASVSTFTFRTVGNPDSPVNDVRVRQALNYAVDKTLLAELIANVAPAVGQGAPSFVAGFNPDILPYPYDPDRARQLLAEAGYGDGMNLSLTVNGTAMTLGILAQRIAQDLAAVGVNLTLLQINTVQWIQKYTLAQFETDLFDLAWNSAPLNDASRPLEYTSCLRARPFFCEASFVPFLEAIQVELDPIKRVKLLQQAQTKVHDLAPAIFMFENVILAAAGPRLHSVPFRLTVPAYDLMTLAKSD